MRRSSFSNRFHRDYKRAKKRRKDLAKLDRVMKSLIVDGALPARPKPHPLVGNWSPAWECHIEPDWLLVYSVSETEVTFLRLGLHSDLFG